MSEMPQLEEILNNYLDRGIQAAFHALVFNIFPKIVNITPTHCLKKRDKIKCKRPTFVRISYSSQAQYF